MKRKTQHSTITVGIPTCYGGQSLVETVRSIRKAKNGNTVRIMIIADRTPITPVVADALIKLRTELTWNPVEGSQTKKVKQMIGKTTSDIYISTQDDITFDENTINEILNAFENDTSLTMAGIRIFPLPPETYFEAAMGSMVRIVDTIAQLWNDTHNHLASSGRCLAFRTTHLKRFRIPENVVNSDMFYYLENKRLDGTFRQLAKALVYIRCPQKLKDQIAPSSRYLYSKKEMQKHFSQKLDTEYRIPILLLLWAFTKELACHPLPIVYYLFIRIYTLVVRQSKGVVSNPVWKVELSTKNSGSTS